MSAPPRPPARVEIVANRERGPRMSPNVNVRWGWVKIMYWYTILGAGLLGLAILLAPDTVKALLR